MSILTSEILPGGIVVLNVNGDLKNENKAEIAAALDADLQMIKEQYLAMGGKIFHMTNITGFTGKYDAEILELFTAFAKGSGEMVAKGVIYGATVGTELIAKMVLMISGRSDVEILHTREEAIESLRKAGAMA